MIPPPHVHPYSCLCYIYRATTNITMYSIDYTCCFVVAILSTPVECALSLTVQRLFDHSTRCTVLRTLLYSPLFHFPTSIGTAVQLNAAQHWCSKFLLHPHAVLCYDLVKGCVVAGVLLFGNNTVKKMWVPSAPPPLHVRGRQCWANNPP